MFVQCQKTVLPGKLMNSTNRSSNFSRSKAECLIPKSRASWVSSKQQFESASNGCYDSNLCISEHGQQTRWRSGTAITSSDIPHIPSKFVEIVPLSHRQGNCIPYAAIRWHDFGNRPALGRPLGHFSRHPDTPLLSLSPRRRFPRPTPERVFVADHQSSSGFSGTGPSAPPPQPIGT